MKDFLSRVMELRNAEQMERAGGRQAAEFVACVDCGFVRRAKNGAGLRCFRCKALKRQREARARESEATP